MLRITASGIGAGPGEKLASGMDESNGRVAPVSAGCGSIATPSTLSEVLGGEGVSTHTVETVISVDVASPTPSALGRQRFLFVRRSSLPKVLQRERLWYERSPSCRH